MKDYEGIFQNENTRYVFGLVAEEINNRIITIPMHVATVDCFVVLSTTMSTWTTDSTDIVFTLTTFLINFFQ